MQALMAFENAPPLAAPLRFFLTAPLFAVFAGLLLALAGPEIFTSRWTPDILAATHLITIGFMLQTMLGALIQILPVVAGANLARPLTVAVIVNIGLSSGALLLASGFHFASPLLLTTAALLLGLTVLLFLAVTLRALIGVPSTSPTIRGLKLALGGLTVVVGLGMLMALALANGWAVPLVALTDLHAAWGLAGWAGILLAAMAYVVVPMFQLTSGYPAKPSWLYPPLMFGLLLLWSIAVLADWPVLLRCCQLLVAVAGIVFAGLTMNLQAKRRRARIDATSRYWQVGLVSSILALFMLSTAAIHPPLAELPGWPLVFGILLILGGFVPFIIGMLYKIVSFLTWLHLQQCTKSKLPTPAMNKLLGDAAMQGQMKAYVAALCLLLAAVFWPEWLARPAGLAFAGAAGWLWWNLLSAVRRYRWHRADIEAKLAAA